MVRDFILHPASADISFSQHYQKIKKESAKNAGPSTPTTTPTKAATNAKTPKSTKSTKSSGTKRKHAESIDASKQDGDEVGAYTNAIGNSDGSPKKIKTDLAHRLGEIIKTEEKLADGSLDLVQDS